MQDFSSIFNRIAPDVMLSEEDNKLFMSVLSMKTVRSKQFLEQPGYVSKHRTFVIKGAFRAFFISPDGQQHTHSLAVDNWFTGDIGSFILQEPATLFVEAIEESTVVQWSYESEQLLLEKIPQFTLMMLRRAQQIAVIIQRRVITHLSLSAEERYNEFVRDYPMLVQRIPLYIIASYLGMSREFLSKIRNHKLSAKS